MDDPHIKIEPLMTVKELKTITRLSLSAIYENVKNGRIPHIKMGSSVRFRPSEIAAWLDRQSTTMESTIDKDQALKIATWHLGSIDLHMAPQHYSLLLERTACLVQYVYAKAVKDTQRAQEASQEGTHEG